MRSKTIDFAEVFGGIGFEWNIDTYYRPILEKWGDFYVYSAYRCTVHLKFPVSEVS